MKLIDRVNNSMETKYRLGSPHEERAQFDPNFLERIKQSYRLSIEAYELSSSDNRVWININKKRMNVHEALMKDDDSFASMVADPRTNNLYYGVDPLALVSSTSYEDPAYRKMQKDTISSQMRSLAECLGIYRLWYGPVPRPESIDYDELLSSLDAYFQTKLSYPAPFPGELGILTDRGLISKKTAWAIYQAWRTLKLCQFVDGFRVLEIGPGLGRAAHYAISMGIADYSTTDLPLGIVGQALYLGAIHGPDAIWMIGDSPEEKAGRIKLYPPSHIEGQYDVVTNVNSFPEMPRVQLEQYFQFCSANSKVVYSMNHEHNKDPRFRDVAAENGLEPSMRFVNSLRPTYIEELFFF